VDKSAVHARRTVTRNDEKESVSPRDRQVGVEPSELLGRQIDHDLDVVVREIPGHAVHAALDPVLVDPTDELDYVALLEAELSLVLRLEVVQGFAARLPSY